MTKLSDGRKIKRSVKRPNKSDGKKGGKKFHLGDACSSKKNTPNARLKSTKNRRRMRFKKQSTLRSPSQQLKSPPMKLSRIEKRVLQLHRKRRSRKICHSPAKIERKSARS